MNGQNAKGNAARSRGAPKPYGPPKRGESEMDDDMLSWDESVFRDEHVFELDYLPEIGRASCRERV